MSWLIAIVWVGSGVYAWPSFCQWQRKQHPDLILTPLKSDIQLLVCMLLGPWMFLGAVVRDTVGGNDEQQ